MPNEELRERTLLIIKPDGVQRGAIGKIVSRFEEKGFKIVGLKMLRISNAQAEKQYACHKGKVFYDSLVKFMTSGPCVAMVLEGRHSIQICRKMMGATDPDKSEPGTIRGDMALDIKYNMVHGSDSEESFKHEMPIYFRPEELMEYEFSNKEWLYFF